MWLDHPEPYPNMLDWLRRKRLSAEGKRKLLIHAARAEEALVETHSANVLELLEAIGTEVDVERAMELYAEYIPMDEHTFATVSNRVLARHDQPAPPALRTTRPDRYRHVFRDGERRR